MKSTLVLVCLLLAASATSAEPICSCARLGGNVTQRLAESGAVFVGTAVYEVRAARRRVPRDPVRVTMVVEKSWKGVTSDTVTVSIDELNCLVHFTPGRTYLVFAHATSAGLFMPHCDGLSPDLNPMWGVGATAHTSVSAAAMIDSLGHPAWVPRAAGKRSIDQAVSSPERVNVHLGLADGYQLRDRMPDIEILGHSQKMTALNEGYVNFRGVPTGLHRARVHLRSGVTEDHYIWVRCDRSAPTCAMGRLIWLRTPPNRWGRAEPAPRRQ